MSENKEYNNMWQEFSMQFKNALLPCVAPYEKNRLQELSKCKIILISCVVTALILFFIALSSLDSSGAIFMFASLIVLSLAFILPIKIKNKFESGLKEKIMPIFCRCIDNFTWCNYYPDSNQLFKEACLVSNYSYYNVNDVFNGRFREIPIDIIDIEFIKKYNAKTDSNKPTTVFKGVVIKLDMYRHFSSHIILKSNSLIKLSPKNGLKRLKLENSEFERNYNVYANDEKVAKALLTRTFMERLKEIEIAFKAKKSTVVFYENYLLFALETPSNLFSFFSFKNPLDDIEQYKPTFNQIHTITKLITYFKPSD